MELELSPEEQKLQDLMDKLSNEIYSELGIPKWKADSAVIATIRAYEAFIQKKLEEEEK